MIQPFPPQTTHTLIPAPASGPGPDLAGFALAVVNTAGSGPSAVNFVTIMAESAPLPPGLTTKSDQTPEMDVQKKETALVHSSPGKSSSELPALSSTQDGAVELENDGSARSDSPELPDPTLTIGMVPAVSAAPAPPPTAPKTLLESHVTAKPLLAFSLAAMAFSDRSLAAQPSAANPNFAPSATDDPAFPTNRGSALPQAAWREGVVPLAGGEMKVSAMLEPDSRQEAGQSAPFPSSVSSPALSLPQRNNPNPWASDGMTQADAKTESNTQGSPERLIPQALAAAAESRNSKRQPMVTGLNPSSAEWPLQSSPDKLKIVSNMAETPPVWQDQSSALPPGGAALASHFALSGLVPDAPHHQGDRFQPISAAPFENSRLPSGPTDAQSAPLHPPLPLQIGMQAVAPHVAPAGPLANPAGGDASMTPEPRLQSGGVPNLSPLPQDVQRTVRPSAALTLDQASSPAVEHNPASTPKGQEAPLSVRDTSMASAAGSADKPHFVTNIAEIRVYPQNPDLASPVLIAMSAEAGLGPQQEDPAPVRPAAAAPQLTAEILRLVPTTPNGPVTVTLRPEELGTLRFEVTQTEHGLHIHLSVDQPQTLDLLRRQGDQLLADLRQAGFAGASLSFAGDGAQDAPPQQREHPQDRLFPSGTLPARDIATLNSPRMAPPGTLDLRL
jgi:hypothetical protein